MSKFLIALNSGSKEQKDAITLFFHNKKYAFWHHLEDVWLVANVPNDITAKLLHNDLESIPAIGSHTILVLKISDDAKMTHWGRAPKAAWDWMQQFFSKASS